MRKSASANKTTNTFSLEDICRSGNMVRNLLDIIESHPDETAVNFGKSIIYSTESNFEKTVSYLECLIQQFPNIVLLRFRIVQSFISEKNYEKAIIHLEKILELDKENLTAEIWLTFSYFKTGNIEKANKYLNDLRRFVYVLKAARENYTELDS